MANIGNEITGSRLKSLRVEAGLNQKEFCARFSDFSVRNTVYKSMTISNWETGRVLPTTTDIMKLSAFYNVTSDYILGLSDKRGDEDGDNVTSIQDRKIKIPFNKLKDYDGKPVFISGPTGSISPQWGILLYKQKVLACPHDNLRIALDARFTYSTTVPQELATNRDSANYYLGLEDIKNMNEVYIESISLDPFLRGQVSGWYHHTPEKTCLINDRGLTLSYEGLDVYYRALGIRKATLSSTKTAKRNQNKAKKK
ncbi:helix-turn-helix domain-containing protein [Butyrivibrio sp. AC2005]|uniref:helix-turn-helix domain-containing protein n=1 Tax=Butyrivibrio sp. AC2005 TaxID=1280672 RepID=UPI000410798A|nr:helix-turn-helix transcriptional regulator [Butyrivibrio sp. AC2005]